MTQPIGLVLLIKKGQHFPKDTSKAVVLEAAFEKLVLPTDPVTLGASPDFNDELVWQTDKKSLHRLRIQKSPIKINCYSVDVDKTKNLLGYIVLDERIAAFKDELRPPKSQWYPLLGVKKKPGEKKPEILLSLHLEYLPDIAPTAVPYKYDTMEPLPQESHRTPFSSYDNRFMKERKSFSGKENRVSARDRTVSSQNKRTVTANRERVEPVRDPVITEEEKRERERIFEEQERLLAEEVEDVMAEEQSLEEQEELPPLESSKAAARMDVERSEFVGRTDNEEVFSEIGDGYLLIRRRTPTPAGQEKSFQLVITIVCAKNLEQLIPDYNASKRYELFWYFSYMEMKHRSESFFTVEDPDFRAIQTVTNIRASLTNLEHYLKKKNLIMRLFQKLEDKNELLGVASIDLGVLCETNLEESSAIIEDGFTLVPADALEMSVVDLSGAQALVGIHVKLKQYEDAEVGAMENGGVSPDGLVDKDGVPVRDPNHAHKDPDGLPVRALLNPEGVYFRDSSYSNVAPSRHGLDEGEFQQSAYFQQPIEDERIADFEKDEVGWRPSVEELSIEERGKQMVAPSNMTGSDNGSIECIYEKEDDHFQDPSEELNRNNKASWTENAYSRGGEKRRDFQEAYARRAAQEQNDVSIQGLKELNGNRRSRSKPDGGGRKAAEQSLKFSNEVHMFKLRIKYLTLLIFDKELKQESNVLLRWFYPLFRYGGGQTLQVPVTRTFKKIHIQDPGSEVIVDAYPEDFVDSFVYHPLVITVLKQSEEQLWLKGIADLKEVLSAPFRTRDGVEENVAIIKVPLRYCTDPPPSSKELGFLEISVSLQHAGASSEKQMYKDAYQEMQEWKHQQKVVFREKLEKKSKENLSRLTAEYVRLEEERERDQERYRKMDEERVQMLNKLIMDAEKRADEVGRQARRMEEEREEARMWKEKARDLKNELELMKSEGGDLREMRLNYSLLQKEKEELAKKLEDCQQNKNYFKEQYASCLRELNQLKFKDQEAEQQRLLDLEKFRLAALAEERQRIEKQDLERMNNRILEVQKQLPLEEQEDATVAAAVRPRTFSGRRDYSPPDLDKEHMNHLLANRDEMISKGNYKPTDDAIRDLDAQIHDIRQRIRQRQQFWTVEQKL